jgi:hypothetical protein
MAVREILKMGDPRLLRLAQAVTAFDTDELHLLVSDLLDTMHAPTALGWRRRKSVLTCSWWCSVPASPTHVTPRRRQCRAPCS